MSLGSLRYLPATRGTLLRLREHLHLVRRGKEILEMRRDQLIREVYKLMDDIKKRNTLESNLSTLLRRLLILYALKGRQHLLREAATVQPPEARVMQRSLQGVVVPWLRELRDPDLDAIGDPELREAAQRLWALLKQLIELAEKEAAVERLTEQLGYINRVVNSLERSIIPQLEELIKYIEERIEEESLGEFVRLKLFRDRREGRP